MSVMIPCCYWPKQLSADVLQDSVSYKCRKILKNTPVVEFLFNKVAGLNFIKNRFQYRCFPVNFCGIFEDFFL